MTNISNNSKLFPSRICLPSCGRDCCAQGVQPMPQPQAGMCPPGCPLVSFVIAVAVIVVDKLLFSFIMVVVVGYILGYNFGVKLNNQGI